MPAKASKPTFVLVQSLMTISLGPFESVDAAIQSIILKELLLHTNYPVLATPPVIYKVTCASGADSPDATC